MRIVYTVGLILGVPLLVICWMMACVWIDDALRKHFGKPPLTLLIIPLGLIAFFLIKAAWDQAGKWVR